MEGMAHCPALWKGEKAGGGGGTCRSLLWQNEADVSASGADTGWEAGLTENARLSVLNAF